MADTARKLAGFTELSFGINNGIAPNRLPNNQAQQAINVSFRGDFPATRSAWKNFLLFGPPTDADSRPSPPASWAGNFQGAMHYDGEAGQSGWLVMRGGRVFFITDDTFIINDVTPRILIITAASFVLPGVGNPVVVSLSGNPPVHVGDTIVFGAIRYTVATLLDRGLRIVQVDAGAGTVPSGTVMFDNSSNQVIQYETYSATINFVYMFQAENYGIILGGQERTMIWDGKAVRLSSIQGDEIPSGFIGAYGWGRIWIVHPDRRTFVAGDIVFGPSGTPQNGYRDAILKFTENDFLNEGGSFGVPYNAGPITAMQFLATQDTSLGVGVLLVGTTNMVFSVNAPVDRTTWKDLTYPIQTVSLIDYGPRSPRATISVNGDLYYRSEDGIRSFIVARRLFGSPGNTPMSHEVDVILDADTPQLVFWGSSIFFDSKLFFTVSPWASMGGQVQHRGMVVINYDLVSDLREKQPPSWEGVNTGVDILQLIKSRINDEERAFIWVQGLVDIELWEIQIDGTGTGDEYTTISGPTTTVTRKPISCVLQTRSEDYSSPLDLKRLIMGEIYIEDIADTVVFDIFYRPDSFPQWIHWQNFTLCSSVSQCTPSVNPCVIVVNARSYSARVTFPQPADLCNAMTGKPAREFHECQYQLSWSGHCRIRRFFTHIKIQTQATEGVCPSTVVCAAFPICDDPLFNYDSRHNQFFAYRSRS